MIFKKSKIIVYSSLGLVLFFCALQRPLAQENKQRELYLNLGFYKVDQDKRASYELLMTDFFGPLMQKRVDEGCLSNWLFRRVLPNSSLYGEFTHITIDIMAPGEKGYWDCDAQLQDVFPGLSPKIRKHLHDEKNSLRKLVHRVRTQYVAGYNSLEKAPQIAIFNLTKTKSNLYEAKHRDGFADFFAEGSNTVAWHAMKRIDPTAWATGEWNYLTVDCYETSAQMQEDVKFSEERDQYYKEKYGPSKDQRDILLRADTRLVFATTNTADAQD
jgi:hypothetical protein